MLVESFDHRNLLLGGLLGTRNSVNIWGYLVLLAELAVFKCFEVNNPVT